MRSIQREFDRLDEVFTPDAYIDYRAMGGIDGRYPGSKGVAEARAGGISKQYCHMIGNMAIKVTGDTASSRTICHSDRGSQYASRDYQQLFADRRIVGSMSRRRDCGEQRRRGKLFRDTERRNWFITANDKRVPPQALPVSNISNRSLIAVGVILLSPISAPQTLSPAAEI